jgi:isopentenyl phosphate kinase
MLTFLKLGGSLITNKNLAHTARLDTLKRLSEEIAKARSTQPDLQLVLGHGSGSFGHQAAQKHGTRQGVHTWEQWLGFIEVYQEARALNQIALEALWQAGLPVIAMPPSAAVLANSGQLISWNLAPLEAALSAGLIPLINGDVIFDQQLGATILSTEELFVFLAMTLRPQRILLAGIEAGVWADFPNCSRLVEEISWQSYNDNRLTIGGSAAVDVTGGMRQKVKEMLELSEKIPGLEALIFSGEQTGQVEQALLNRRTGTLIHA